MFDVFHVLIQWFGQPPSFPVIAVDVVFFLIGIWLVLVEWHNAKRVMLYSLALVVFSMLLQFVPLFFCELVALLLCGLGTMALLGTLAGYGLMQLLRALHRRNQDQQQKDPPEDS